MHVTAIRETRRFGWANHLIQRQLLAAHDDERHVLLVGGTRAGKGTGTIIPTLCRWQGSCIVVDPKGENAMVTAARRGPGSRHAQPMGQSVFILDPFDIVDVDPTLKAYFNPLAAIDPDGPYAVEDAGSLAEALVPPRNRTDPFWDEWARTLIKNVILYTLVEKRLENRRDLVSVWRLITQGAWLQHECAMALLPPDRHAQVSSKHDMLWNLMASMGQFGGAIAGQGQRMKEADPKTLATILTVAAQHMEFISGPAIQKCLTTETAATRLSRTFRRSQLKTILRVTIYLTLPQRYMETHARWLRLMISAAVSEMERVRVKPRATAPFSFWMNLPD